LAKPHVQIDGTIDHGWLLLLSAVFAHGDTPFVERKLPREGSSQPLHLISVAKLGVSVAKDIDAPK